MSLSSLSGRVGALSAAALVERITMEADLRNALVTGDLVLRYHPIVDLHTGHTIAFEALCRWRHSPAGGCPAADLAAEKAQNYGCLGRPLRLGDSTGRGGKHA